MQVVVTTLLGWLERRRHIVSPAHPYRMSRAIDWIIYRHGNPEKVFMCFPKAFLDDVGRGAGRGVLPIETLFSASKKIPFRWRYGVIYISGLPQSLAQPVIMHCTSHTTNGDAVYPILPGIISRNHSSYLGFQNHIFGLTTVVCQLQR